MFENWISAEKTENHLCRHCGWSSRFVLLHRNSILAEFVHLELLKAWPRKVQWLHFSTIRTETRMQSTYSTFYEGILTWNQATLKGVVTSKRLGMLSIVGRLLLVDCWSIVGEEPPQYRNIFCQKSKSCCCCCCAPKLREQVRVHTDSVCTSAGTPALTQKSGD